MKKLTIDQLKNYLGTGLKFRLDPNAPILFELSGVNLGFNEVTGDTDILQEDFHINKITPLCYRLSDMDKFIPELGFVPAEKLFYGAWMIIFKEFIKKNNQLDRISYNDIQKLFEWNFWVFDQDYFEQGLVIDKLKL